MTTNANGPKLGEGIFTASDIARILNIKYARANYWLQKYWASKLAEHTKHQYTFETDGSYAINFKGLVEFYISNELNKQGVSIASIAKAHTLLAKEYNTPYPFASREIIEHLKTDGKKLYATPPDEIIVSLDGSRQLNLDFIQLFFKKLDFDEHETAVRLWPLGKERQIVVDPRHQFGSPVIKGTNIHPATIAGLVEAGDPDSLIQRLYDISPEQIQDAVDFDSLAA